MCFIIIVCVKLPLVQTLDVVREGCLGSEGPDLPVLDPTQHAAEAGVRGPGLGAGTRLILNIIMHYTFIFYCIFLSISYGLYLTFSIEY